MLLFCPGFASGFHRSARRLPGFYKGWHISGIFDAALGNKYHIVRCQFSQTDAVIHIHLEGSQITVIDSDDLRSAFNALATSSSSCASTSASIPSSFASCLYSSCSCHPECTDQKYRRCTKGFCLIDHILIHCKILAEYRNIHCCCDLRRYWSLPWK